MTLPLHFPLRVPTLLLVAAASGAALSCGAWLLLRGRKKKSDAEREHERCMKLNDVGRMTDGRLMEAFDAGDPDNQALLFYRYSIRGVEYSAAQDVSALRNLIPAATYLPGETVVVKYDRHQPSNSIVVCESWSGLRPVATRRSSPK